MSEFETDFFLDFLDYLHDLPYYLPFTYFSRLGNILVILLEKISVELIIFLITLN
jgi:hypothetical protein